MPWEPAATMPMNRLQPCAPVNLRLCSGMRSGAFGRAATPEHERPCLQMYLHMCTRRNYHTRDVCIDLTLALLKTFSQCLTGAMRISMDMPCHALQTLCLD